MTEFVPSAPYLEIVREHHLLSGDFVLSNGGRSTEYLDLRSAMLCDMCRGFLMVFFVGQRPDSGPIVYVSTGTFGALLLARLALQGPVALWNPKGHGVEWSGPATTGTTMRRLVEATENRGLTVIKTAVAFTRISTTISVKGE